MARRILSLPLYQVPFVVLDVETTGLHPGLGHAICEIAVLRVQDGAVVEEYQSLVDPGRPVSPEAYAVNRISSTMLRGAPRFEEIADRVLDALEGSAVVAHNAPFDLGFLVAALEETHRLVPDNPVVDTLALARNCYGFPSNNLQSIARDLGIFIPQEHRALGDVWTTWRVLEFFSQDLQARWGISTLGELVHAQGGPIEWPRPLSHSGLPETLARALEENLLLQVHYRSSDGQVTRRTVEPLRVGTYRGTTYLVARCLLRGEQRTFRLDRILEMHLHRLGRPAEE